MTHRNEEILRKSDEAMDAGDIEGFFSYFTDDVVVHATGQSSLAGTYKGKDQLQQLFGRFMDAVGDYSFENHAYLADDEHGITMQKGRAVKNGETIELDEIFVMHFRDGKISEMWYVPTDQARFDAWVES
jgi:ketosteroid isomerase-like protein